ncbi:MAG: antibiotic biosynthesis monooxygenase [Cyclobacteriaceae bacterium]|nr:antibiotic biosynthesis monooxygenase [Cyclobacteriaceae bacterium]
MSLTMVHVHVKSGFMKDFIEATKVNHENSIQEPGNLRFDVIQDPTDECKFILYEAYISDEAASAHKETSHYKVWRDTVAPWMENPRQGVKYKMLCPDFKKA